MAIKIPGTAFHGVSSFGAAPPEAGFYAVTISKIETNSKDKPGTRRFHVQFENGFRMFEFIHLAYDESGNVLPGLAENQIKGRLAALRTILESLGYSSSDIEGAGEINDAWFIADQNGGRKGYVEFTPGQRGVQGSYSNIEGWMTKTAFEARKVAGVKKAAPAVDNAPAKSAPPTVNGTAPSAGVALPPPPAAAQTIAN